jgi:uncharacterized RDD family membrane protein YckC
VSDLTIAYAGFWKRLLAYIIDVLIMIVPLFIIGFIVSYFVISAAKTELEIEAFSAGAEGLTSIMSIIVAWVYYATMESSAKQGTLGKMALGIIVTDYKGRKISFGKASGRFFGKILSGLLLGTGFLMVGFTNKKQGLHDIMAGTLIQFKNQWNEKYHNEDQINKTNGYQNPVKTGSTIIKPIKNNSSFSKDTNIKQVLEPKTSISKKEKLDIKIQNEVQKNESKFYEQIWKEIDKNKTDVGLWAKCFADCEGDENKTKALYVNKKIATLKEELRQQVLDKEREAEERLKTEEAVKLAAFEGKCDGIEIFKESLSKNPGFFSKILGKYGYKIIQNQNRPEMWSIQFPNGRGAKHVYNLYDLRSEIKKIVLKQES